MFKTLGLLIAVCDRRGYSREDYWKNESQATQWDVVERDDGRHQDACVAV
jgi:hypothetical protein